MNRTVFPGIDGKKYSHSHIDASLNVLHSHFTDKHAEVLSKVAP